MLSPFEGLLLCFGSGKSLRLSHMNAVEIISVCHLPFRQRDKVTRFRRYCGTFCPMLPSCYLGFSSLLQYALNKQGRNSFYHAFYLLFCFIALERTFLGYLRTSLALSIVAVIIAQLFRLEHNVKPNKTFGFYVLSIPLSCACIGAAMVILLFGAYRFWRQQNAILRGKVHAGGWEVNAIAVTVFMVCGKQLPT